MRVLGEGPGDRAGERAAGEGGARGVLVEAERVGKPQCLGDERDPADHGGVDDQFERGAGSGRAGTGDRAEPGQDVLDAVRVAAGEDAEPSGGRPVGAAHDGRVDQGRPVAEAGGEVPYRVRADGGHLHPVRAGRQRGQDGVGDRGERGRPGEHRDHHVGVAYGVGRGRGVDGALGDQRTGLRGRTVPDGQRMAGGEEAPGHGRTHVTQPQKGDLLGLSHAVDARFASWMRQANVWHGCHADHA